MSITDESLKQQENKEAADAKTKVKASDLRGNAKLLATWLSISSRRVNQLVETGVLTKQAEGDFILPEAVAEYYAYKFGNKDEVDLIREKALHERDKREMTELNLAVRKGELHESSVVERVMMDMLINFKNKLLALPSKITLNVAAKKQKEIRLNLAEELNKALEELSDYSPDLFQDDGNNGQE